MVARRANPRPDSLTMKQKLPNSGQPGPTIDATLISVIDLETACVEDRRRSQPARRWILIWFATSRSDSAKRPP